MRLSICHLTESLDYSTRGFVLDVVHLYWLKLKSLDWRMEGDDHVGLINGSGAARKHHISGVRKVAFQRWQ